MIAKDLVTWLHEQRLQAVLRAIHRSRARTVLDLGCGTGPLLRRLLHEPAIDRVVGLDRSAAALRELQALLQAEAPEIRGKAELVLGSFTAPDGCLAGFDAAILIETIEHIEPDELSLLERSVFRDLTPRTVVISTPNREFNVLLGVPNHRRRHPDHRFEWDRPKFRSWATGVAHRNGYAVWFEDVAGAHPEYGGPTQMATFEAQRAGLDLHRGRRRTPMAVSAIATTPTATRVPQMAATETPASSKAPSATGPRAVPTTMSMVAKLRIVPSRPTP